MTVETAALTQQELETATVAPTRRQYPRKDLFGFLALVGIVELAWLVLLYQLVARFA